MSMAGREALLRYVLRPPVAQERIEQGPEGLLRIALKRLFADGTVAVEMDRLSLLCRLAIFEIVYWRSHARNPITSRGVNAPGR
jgi:hypothetical protein